MFLPLVTAIMQGVSTITQKYIALILILIDIIWLFLLISSAIIFDIYE